jgi:hypothetical protein
VVQEELQVVVRAKLLAEEVADRNRGFAVQ